MLHALWMTRETRLLNPSIGPERAGANNNSGCIRDSQRLTGLFVGVIVKKFAKYLGALGNE